MKKASLLAVLLLAAAGILPARALADGERIGFYAIAIEIEADGSLLVREEIAYDFGSSERHGIFREIVTKQRYDERYDRSYPLDVLSVTATPPSTPADYTIEDVGGGMMRVRIGDADRTISGLHTYTITYRLRGALNSFDDHDELYWNVIDARWDVPIARASVTVRAPAAPTSVVCFAGPTGSNAPCDSAAVEGGRAVFAHADLDTFEGLTIAVALPKGAVAEPAPIRVSGRPSPERSRSTRCGSRSCSPCLRPWRVGSPGYCG